MGGADWTPPTEDQVLNTPPCGYLLNSLQAELVSVQAELFGLETKPVGEGAVFFPMDQPLGAVIPLLLDARAAHNLVDGLALDDCENLAAVELPGGAPTSSASAQFYIDFSEDAPGEAPADWSQVWHSSRWEVVDSPRLLRHTVEGSNSRRALVWDEPGIVSGDVEVRTAVRFLSAATFFQLPILISGEAGSENAYYLDVRRSDGMLRLNRYLNGAFTTLARASFKAEVGKWYHLRFRREGAELLARVWLEGEPEPEQWQIRHQDTSLLTGAVGVAGFHEGSVNDWAFFSVGTGGESAPEKLIGR